MVAMLFGIFTCLPHDSLINVPPIRVIAVNPTVVLICMGEMAWSELLVKWRTFVQTSDMSEVKRSLTSS